MTEVEWEATPAGGAITALLRFTVSASMVTLASEVGKWASSLFTWFTHLPGDHAKHAKFFDSGHQAALRKGLVIVGAWSAFEAGVEDFTKGIMQTDPQLFEGLRLGKNTVTAGQLLLEDGRDEVYDRINKALRSTHTYGFVRWEEMFAKIGLTGPPIAREIADTFMEAQALRHVWAHNAGFADATFLTSSTRITFQRGQLVDIDRQRLSQYVASIMGYAMIIANRHRALHNLGPMLIEGIPAERPIGRVYNAMYPALRAGTPID